MKDKADFTIGLRGGTWYAFHNNLKAREFLIRTSDSLHNVIQKYLETHGYTYDFEKVYQP